MANKLYASVSYTNTATNLLIPFGYLSVNDLHVYVDDTEVPKKNIEITHGNMLSVDHPINFSFKKITINRVTDIKETLKIFTGGNRLLAKDLNQLAKFHLYTIQELIDKFANVLVVGADGNIDLKGKRLENVGNPSANTDAVSKQYMTDHFTVNAVDINKINALITRANTLDAQLNTLIHALNKSVYDVTTAEQNIKQIQPSLNTGLTDATNKITDLQKLIAELKTLKPIQDNFAKLDELIKKLPTLTAAFNKVTSELHLIEAEVKKDLNEVQTNIATIKAESKSLTTDIPALLSKFNSLEIYNPQRTHKTILQSSKYQTADYSLEMPDNVASNDNSALVGNKDGKLNWHDFTPRYILLETAKGKQVRIYPNADIISDTKFKINKTGQLSVVAVNNTGEVSSWINEELDADFSTHINNLFNAVEYPTFNADFVTLQTGKTDYDVSAIETLIQKAKPSFTGTFIIKPNSAITCYILIVNGTIIYFVENDGTVIFDILKKSNSAVTIKSTINPAKPALYLPLNFYTFVNGKGYLYPAQYNIVSGKLMENTTDFFNNVS